MILHCVFCNFRADATATERASVFEALDAFATALPGVMGFEHGPNRDFEAKSLQFDAGFVVRFQDRESLKIYADHPTHRSLGARLCDLCQDGADGIIVFDLEVG